MSKPIYIDWCAKDALDGMMHLSDAEELAYRRILDMIYASDDNLEDNDESLKWSTKAGTKWPKIKKRLLDLNKIEVVDNRVTNKVCQENLAAAHARIEQNSRAGKASAEARKQLNLLNTGSTGVTTDVPTGEATNHQSPITKEYKHPLSSQSPREEKIGVGVLKNGSGGKSFDIIAKLSDAGLAAAKAAAPGWDIYRLAKIYNEGIETRGIPNVPDKAFPAWCRNYTKGKPP